MKSLFVGHRPPYFRLTVMTAPQQAHSQEPTPAEVVHNLMEVKRKIELLATQHNLVQIPRLVAVSKSKPVELIKACYDAGHRHFGENYVQELIAKFNHLPRDIQWHFIGHLQLNKVKKLIRDTWNAETSQPGLFVVESVDSLALATALNNAVSSQQSVVGIPKSQLDTKLQLTVFVQVHTSDEETKFGVAPQEAVALVESIRTQCPHLKFKGLMTIGALKGDPTQDFQKLVNVQQQVCEQLHIPKSEVELSMGMSNDYEKAIAHGSTNLRIGSLIFGERHYHK